MTIPFNFSKIGGNLFNFHRNDREGEDENEDVKKNKAGKKVESLITEGARV